MTYPLLVSATVNVGVEREIQTVSSAETGLSVQRAIAAVAAEMSIFFIFFE